MIPLEIATTATELGSGGLSPLAELSKGEQLLPDKALNKSFETRGSNDLEHNLRSIPVAKVLDKMGFPDNWMDIQNITKKELF